MTTILSRSELSSSGVSSRNRRQGPEKSLVDWFLSELPIDVPTRHRLSIFEEPRLDSGFPDLVLVIWDEQIASSWNAARGQLSKSDIKVLHCLFQKRIASQNHLEMLLGRNLTKSIDKLVESDLIIQKGNRWTTRPLREIYAAKRIIAIEAKVSDVSKGLEQATLNNWFAHDSFLLLPKNARAIHHGKRAERWDVQVIARDEKIRIKPTIRNNAPRSYVSWLFNEWVWKASACGIA